MKGEKEICKLCNKELFKKGMFTHMERVHMGLNSKYSSGNNGKYDTQQFKSKITFAAKVSQDNKYGKKQIIKKICKKCDNEFEIYGRPLRPEIIQKEYCSQSCANSRAHTEIGRKNISNGINRYLLSKPKGIGIKKKYCKWCLVEFSSIKNKGFCSDACKNAKLAFIRAIRRINLSDKKKYQLNCKFNFNLKDFPKEFDFELLQEHGMYKAANHGNNLTGVSRDHMISIDYGFKNNIKPEIISHPANCKLILQTENSSKYKKCSITIEELLLRIEDWDKKYKF